MIINGKKYTLPTILSDRLERLVSITPARENKLRRVVVEDEFDEDLHPRDEKGQFTSGGGEGASGSSTGGEKDRSGTKVGNTTYENFSKMSKDDQYDTLYTAAENMGRNFDDDFYNECAETIWEYDEYEIADLAGVDTEGTGWSSWGASPPEYDLDTSEGWDLFVADHWSDVADRVLTEVMSEKDAKKCMDKMWDKYSK